MAKREDHTKLGNLVLSMAKATGHVPNAEDCAKMHQALDLMKGQMQNEDPNGTICCNEGHTHLNCEVDVWGTCPDMM
jgi:hypothetical protein